MNPEYSSYYMVKNKTEDIKFFNTKLENCPSSYYSLTNNYILS